MTLSLTINETLGWLSSLPTLMQESFWRCLCSDRYIQFPLTLPPYPLLPVKHHVYLSSVLDCTSIIHRSRNPLSRTAFLIRVNQNGLLISQRLGAFRKLDRTCTTSLSKLTCYVWLQASNTELEKNKKTPRSLLCIACQVTESISYLRSF